MDPESEVQPPDPVLEAPEPPAPELQPPRPPEQGWTYTDVAIVIVFALGAQIVIFLLALVVGSIMGGLRLFVARRAWRRAGGR